MPKSRTEARPAIVRRLRLAFALSLIAACGGSPEPARTPAPAATQHRPRADAPSCAEVVASVRKVVLESSGATSEEEREHVAESLEPTIEQTRRECETMPWSSAYRRCAHAARGEHAMLACDREAAIERGEDVGGASCEQVAGHLTKVTIDPIGTEPEHREELRKRFATYCQPWSRAHKACVLAATNKDEITACGQR
jgi:hypothetical protein